jgi:hypothetical protein
MTQRTAPTDRKVVLDALRKIGFSRVVCTYSGSGDDGWVQSPTFTPKARATKAAREMIMNLNMILTWDQSGPVREQKGIALEEAVRQILEDALESKYDGWEDGDGASGTITWDVKSDKIKIQHNEYYTEARESEAEL